MPATEDTVYRAACQLLKDAWETNPALTWTVSTPEGPITIPGVPIEFPNTPSIRSAARQGDTDKPRPWARFVWQPVEGACNIGATRTEQSGVLSVEVYAPAGKDMTLVNALVTVPSSVYRRASLPGGGFFKNPRFRTVGNVDGDYFRKDFLVEYQFDEGG
jgi:hypothetical protein